MSAWYRSPAEVRAEVERSRKPALSILSSETSNEAARKIEPARGTLRAKVLETIRNPRRYRVTFGRVDDTHYSEVAREEIAGVTDEEGCELSGIPASTWRPRRVELVEMNLVVDSGVRRKTRSGRDAVVWIAS